jgi:hypothetical protein
VSLLLLTFLRVFPKVLAFLLLLASPEVYCCEATVSAVAGILTAAGNGKNLELLGQTEKNIFEKLQNLILGRLKNWNLYIAKNYHIQTLAALRGDGLKDD